MTVRVRLLVPQRFELRDPTFGVAFACRSTDLELRAIVILPPYLKRVQRLNFISPFGICPDQARWFADERFIIDWLAIGFGEWQPHAQ